MLGGILICGPAAAGFTIGWLIGFRARLPFSREVVKLASLIGLLAVPYLLLAIAIAGLDTGIAALVAVLAGMVAYSCVILRLQTASRGG